VVKPRKQNRRRQDDQMRGLNNLKAEKLTQSWNRQQQHALNKEKERRANVEEIGVVMCTGTSFEERFEARVPAGDYA
jgi:hypothetical protein